MNKFGFNDIWVTTLTLPQFKDWATQNQAKHEMSDVDVEAYWNSLQPAKAAPLPEIPKVTKPQPNENGTKKGGVAGAKE